MLAALVLCGILNIVSCQYKAVLPPPNQLLNSISNFPAQESTEIAPFVFEYMNNDYLVDPVADYELWGLVVTHNNIHSIGDMYHDKYSVDIKDLCVIWGDNAKSDAYLSTKFWSDPFTCWHQNNDSRAADHFYKNDLSNNHLLSDDKRVREKIRSVQIGDQIRMKGMLVNYSAASAPGWTRDSSITRTDTGNGACEVFFVEEVDILKRNRPVLNKIYSGSKDLGLLLVIMTPLIWLIAIFLEQKRIYIDIF